MWFNTFDEVVKRYDTTKVLVSSKHNREDNIRPIGARSRKWERIVKYDDNTYALTDGNYDRSLWSKSTNHITETEKEYSKLMSPILWERKKDGDYMTVRNGTIGGAHCSRYKFISMYLPHGMGFKVTNGRQYIQMRGGVGYELPKTSYRMDWQKGEIHCEDDGMKLRFRGMGDGTLERTGDLIQTTTVTVDKEAKLKYKPIIKEYFAWMCAIVPMLDNSWSGRDDYLRALKEWADENSIHRRYWSPQLGEIPLNYALDIMTNDEHPMRLPLAVLINQNVAIHETENEADIKLVKARYNTAMNKLFKLYTTKYV